MSDAVPTTIIVNFYAKPARAKELRDLLMTAAPRLAQLPGCRGGSIHNDIDDPELFVLIEHWDSKDAHQAYIDRVERDGTMEKMMPLLARPPERRYLTGKVG